jgi:hypothetical protein
VSAVEIPVGSAQGKVIGPSHVCTACAAWPSLWGDRCEPLGR